MTLEEFHNELMQDVKTRAAARSDLTESAFMEMVAEGLADSGAIQDFTPCNFRHKKGMRIDGYGFVDEEATLDLFIEDYRWTEEPEMLSRKEVESVFQRAEKFYQKASTPGFHEDIEVTHPAWGLIRQIGQQAEALRRIRFHLVTNAKLPLKVNEIPSRIEDGCEWSYCIWDLAAICRLMTTGEPEEIVIDFEEMFGRPLPCLPANQGADTVTSYLSVIPGDWLAVIYDKYAGRLLEQNVRTFLQLRGKVNKGIRRTILEDPHMFFAYNNGISATAAEAEHVSNGEMGFIRRVRRFQIVNGGQTTASIFNVMKKEKGKNLTDIRVQMKLSVVTPDKVDTIVPKISQYANSQNRVSDADFFSNHPFHIRIEGISRRLWAPAVGGSQIQTHWFYERARGQYANAQAYLTPARKREFQLQNPRGQVITKTDLAKVEMTFMRQPHVVSLGAQKNFARFAEYVGDFWGDDGVAFGDDWYQVAVAKSIVFKITEKLVQDAPWYAQGYRANIVTYAIALLQEHLTRKKSELDFVKIWQRQQVTDILCSLLIEIGEKVQRRIVEAASNFGVSNVTEWCKKKGCWDDVLSRVNVKIGESFDSELLSQDDARADRRTARHTQRITNEIDAQREVLDRGSEFWQNLLAWAEAKAMFAPSEISALKVATAIPRRIPNGQQSIKVLEVLKKAEEEGCGLITTI